MSYLENVRLFVIAFLIHHNFQGKGRNILIANQFMHLLVLCLRGGGYNGIEWGLSSETKIWSLTSSGATSEYPSTFKHD